MARRYKKTSKLDELVPGMWRRPAIGGSLRKPGWYVRDWQIREHGPMTRCAAVKMMRKLIPGRETV